MHFKQLLPEKSVSAFRGIGSFWPILFIFIIVLSIAFINSWSSRSLASLESNLKVIGGPSNTQYTSTTGDNSQKIIWQSEGIQQLSNKFALAEEKEESSYILSQNSLTNPNYPTNNSKSGSNKIITYTVKKGDSVSSIANQFNISVETIIWANGISEKKLKLGQKIKILPISGLAHEVAIGESLAEIADFYSANEKEIVDFNDLSNNPINPGQVIIIPNGKITSLNMNKSENLPYYPDYYLIPAAGINWGQIHLKNAVDIANRCNTTIIASAEGLVLETGHMNGYGNYIKIQHPNNTKTLYAHLEKIIVDKGDFVDRGEIIGAMGNTGRSTGCHLHFEIRGAVNPFGR